jgi:hypothetical protein
MTYMPCLCLKTYILYLEEIKLAVFHIHFETANSLSCSKHQQLLVSLLMKERSILYLYNRFLYSEL